MTFKTQGSKRTLRAILQDKFKNRLINFLKFLTKSSKLVLLAFTQLMTIEISYLLSLIEVKPLLTVYLLSKLIRKSIKWSKKILKLIGDQFVLSLLLRHKRDLRGAHNFFRLLIISLGSLLFNRKVWKFLVINSSLQRLLKHQT